MRILIGALPGSLNALHHRDGDVALTAPTLDSEVHILSTVICIISILSLLGAGAIIASYVVGCFNSLYRWPRRRKLANINMLTSVT